jgi:RNA polymerase sigma-70 factor (ECF subfamily)
MTSSPLSTLTDAQLMERVAEDDVAAFEEIYRRHGKGALRAAYRIVRQPAAAEEVTQEAFLSLWRSAAGYQPARSSLRSWLLLLVHNRAIDQIRRARHHNTNLDITEVHEEHLEDPERTDARAAAREQSRNINALLRTIPIKQRQIVELAYYGEMTPPRDRHEPRPPPGHRQGTSAPRPSQAAPRARPRGQRADPRSVS